jgi:hypothetical protein
MLQSVGGDQVEKLIRLRLVDRGRGMAPRQEPQLRPAQVLKLSRVRCDLHAVGQHRRAGRNGTILTADFHQAKSAGSDRRETGIMA